MRTCATCNVELSIGYAVEVTGECFCTAKCLHEKYPSTSTDEELEVPEVENEPLFTLSFNLDDFNE